MRSRSSWLTLAAFGSLACNAILGNESDYSLADGAGAGGEPGGGAQAVTAGTTSKGGNAVSGGMSGEAGSVGEAGDGNAAGASGSSSGGEGGQSGEECLAPSRCVPAPAGSDLGFVTTDPLQSCPTGYSEVELHSGLTDPGACTGCSCAPKAARCDSSIVSHGSFACPGFQTSGNSFVLLSTGCAAISPGTSVHFYDVRGFAECTPQGVGTPAAPVWNETLKFCKLNAVPTGGCPAGSRCLAAATAPTCALLSKEGSCSAAYPNAHAEPVATDFDDQRTCGECQCGFGNSDCTGGKIQVFSGGNCTGSMAELGPAQGDSCSLPFTPVSGTVVGTAAANTCAPDADPSGTLEPVEPVTLCCK